MEAFACRVRPVAKAGLRYLELRGATKLNLKVIGIGLHGGADASSADDPLVGLFLVDVSASKRTRSSGNS